jgi:hypothetical protein
MIHWGMMERHKIERATICKDMTDYEYLLLIKQRGQVDYFYRDGVPRWMLGDVEPIDSMGVTIFGQEYNVVYLNDRSGWLYLCDCDCDGCGRQVFPWSDVYHSKNTSPSRAHFFFWMNNYK